MGRHAALELDCPTEVIARPVAPPVGWLDKATDAVATASRGAKIGGIVALGVVAAGLSIASGAHSGTFGTTTSPTASAKSSGIAEGTALREQGWDSASIILHCAADGGGYTGDQYKAYKLGCTSMSGY